VKYYNNNRRNNKDQKAEEKTIRERERVNGTNRTYIEAEGHFKYNVELQ
jgi:hypothetical protein